MAIVKKNPKVAKYFTKYFTNHEEKYFIIVIIQYSPESDHIFIS